MTLSKFRMTLRGIACLIALAAGLAGCSGSGAPAPGLVGLTHGLSISL